MSYVYDCDQRPDLPFPEVKRLLGGKAANLAVMAGDLGLPVPPAFTITTAACIEYLAHGWPDGLDAELREHMARMERIIGESFGGPGTPLLVSVRSGAPVSMPGMMDTILNLGLTERDRAGLAASSGSEKFARNCRNRFDAMFRDVVGVDGVPDDAWTQLRLADRGRLPLLEQRPGPDLSRARGDRRRPRHGGHGPGDGLRQPRASIRGPASCSRATRRPASPGSTATSCSTPRARTSSPAPIGPSRSPSSTSGCRPSAAELRDYAARLEHHTRDLCDIEFTIEHGRLWMLQMPRRQAQSAGRAPDRAWTWPRIRTSR